MEFMSKSVLPAEWERHAFTMMAWPDETTDWAYMLDDAQKCIAEIADAISQFEPVLMLDNGGNSQRRYDAACNLFAGRVVECQHNDTWCRDYGCITLRSKEGALELNDFVFNGWGMKFAAYKDNQCNNVLLGCGAICLRADLDSYRNVQTVLEGGGIESDGKGTIMTTSEFLLSRNRNGFLCKEEAERVLGRLLGAERFLWLDHGYLAGDDTDSHVDTLARFAPDDTILYVQAVNPDDEHTLALNAMEAELRSFRTMEGKPYRLVALPMTPPIYDCETGERLPATYANFYYVNGGLLFPTYGVPETDSQAESVFKSVFPNLKVVGVDCRALIRQHGSLHCSTMQYPEGLRLG